MRQLFTTFALFAFLSGASPLLAQPAKASAPHAHPDHGPHNGDLIELGNEEYHLEMVHDEKAGTIAFYLLDSSAKKMLAIPAKEIVVNVKVAGKGKQYKIPPYPQPNDPKDNFSAYGTKDKDLIATLNKHGIEAHVAIEIGGKPYRGKIEHHHDHGPATK
jgi:hypothetical protein